MTISTLPDAGSLTAAEHDAAAQQNAQRPWSVVVWDDPVNTMGYVSYVFQTYFKYSAEDAEELMLRVHHAGSAVVATGSREKAETDVQAMHSYGLQATVRKDGDD
ncbi:ATP-dependent Clp protease adapter ClpS [Psychromicrobium xiongbiense]|uniref:ATP-dependent Clp protease adapter ClpS n=1 Tax=Psychromicrobium xiongbiense TaxID=3051184 RepID=UPI002557B667|nr:ATP-dependent Clp protease adapter ClpS [Psychromicrobium sp. YIM S02556]